MVVHRQWIRLNIYKADFPLPQTQRVISVVELLAAPALGLAQLTGSQVAATADLLAMDAKGIE
ncbi:MAG: hypothetical protein ACREDR_14385, partial [Blastocatellia bacterium]